MAPTFPLVFAAGSRYATCTPRPCGGNSQRESKRRIPANDAHNANPLPTGRLDRAALSLLFLLPAAARAEEVIDWSRDSIVPRNLDAADAAASANTARANRIRLFRITPGFLSDPVGLTDPDEQAAPDDPADPAPDWLTVTMGPDNPFFDLRRPGDPGASAITRFTPRCSCSTRRTPAAPSRSRR